MARLKSNLGKILKEKNISPYRLSVELKHNRYMIENLAKDEYLVNRMLPSDLLANICEFLHIEIHELLEVDKDAPSVKKYL